MSQMGSSDPSASVPVAGTPTTDKATRVRVLKQQNFDDSKYEYNFKWKPADPDNPWSVHTTADLLNCLERNKKIGLESRILSINNGQLTYKRMNRKPFVEAYLHGSKKLSRFKEWDLFSTTDGPIGMSGRVGNDFTPLLGGPFYKNLYYYEDYIRMHAECFYAYHNDPIAKAIACITRDFVLGTGYEMQCDTSDVQGQQAMALWKTFEEVNDLQQQIDDTCLELSVYGETMFWWLPNNQTKIVYRLGPQDTIPIGIIPRVRLIDPSNIVEIVTLPEDITRKLWYVWLTPTQYQIYTSATSSNIKEPPQPSLKFIYQQIPAWQMLHYKINSVSNEKRGRSDFFPVLSYLKRLRDSVNYSIIALQKNSAWSIDTTVDGSQSDIDDYVAAQDAMGTIPPAGSEFVHSKAIERQYLGNQHASAHTSDAFQWCLSLICAGVQIPVNWLGTHLSGGNTRASAIVATEPVAKKMEKRREVMKRILTDMWKRLMKEAGLPEIPCRVIFPEMITQDRSQKLKDLDLAENKRWISPQRAASMSAKELGIDDYNYEAEIAQMQVELPKIPQPLSDPGWAPEDANLDQGGSTSAVTQDERVDIKKNGSKL